jgi:hypothetical protein
MLTPTYIHISYIHIPAYAYIHISYIHISYIHIHAYSYIHMSYIHIPAYAYIHISYIHIHASSYIHISYIHTYMYMLTPTYICAYIEVYFIRKQSSRSFGTTVRVLFLKQTPVKKRRLGRF